MRALLSNPTVRVDPGRRDRYDRRGGASMGRTAKDVTTTRTFALVGHRSSGKTSLGDQLLQVAGVTRAPGRVDDGTSLLDHEAEERRRRMTLAVHVAWLEWQPTEAAPAAVLHLVDTPGAEGLAHEQALALACVDGALVVVSAIDGVQVGTRRVIEEARRSQMPIVVAITRMDRAFTVDAVLEAIQAEVGDARAVAVQAPIRDAAGRIERVVSLFDDPSADPAAWERLCEAVALADDTLLERYLEEFGLPADEVRAALPSAVCRGKLVPVAFTSGATGLGAAELLGLVLDAFPDPAKRRRLWAMDGAGDEVPVDPDGPFVAQLMANGLDDEGNRYHVLRVWGGSPPKKGTWVHGESGASARVHKLYALRGPRAANPRHDGAGALIATWDTLSGRPGDTYTDGARLVLGAPPVPAPMVAAMLTSVDGTPDDRLYDKLLALSALDPALEVTLDELTGHPIVSGAGQDHIDRALERLQERYGVRVVAHLPPVGYRETPAGSVQQIQGIHRRVSDGEVAEFGACFLDLQPQPPWYGNAFADASQDVEQLPKRFLPSIDEGVRRGMRHGPSAGYPVLGADVRCTGGEYDILQSTEEHFRLAGERGVKLALEKAGTKLLEPWWSVDVRVPAGEVGVILAEIGARRGRITGLEVDGREATVYADCPFRELRTFGPRLQALTAGRGRYLARPSHYDALPANLVREAIASSPFRADTVLQGLPGEAGREVPHRTR
jgi:elongation factor G